MINEQYANLLFLQVPHRNVWNILCSTQTTPLSFWKDHDVTQFLGEKKKPREVRKEMIQLWEGDIRYHTNPLFCGGGQ